MPDPLSIVWTHDADKDVARLDRATRDRVRRAIEQFAAEGLGDVVEMKAPEPGYRLHVGEWRVRFAVDRGTHVMAIYGVFARGDAYKRR
jgi:mRNA-degrading endonuclease RelE of RelBE toxin-antitoxin system